MSLRTSRDIQMRSLLGAPDMSAGPEDARGLRRASIGNASVAPRDTEKLARLRRARKEAARDIEAERRTDDARVTELHARLDAKLRERNERRVRLLRLESERIAVEREVRFAHAAAERDAAATRLDAERGDEAAKKEARRVAFLARRRAAASGVASRAAAEERWERLNETAADEAARTPRLRETKGSKSFVAYDAMAVSQFGREMNEGVAATTENVLAAFESAAAVSAASPVPPPPPPTEFEFEVAVGVAARVASPSRGDAAICAARLGVSRGREDRLRRVANERGAPDDVLETETETETPFVAGSDSDSDDARSDVSDDSAESVLESAPGIESPDRMRGRMRVRAGGVAWTSPSSAPRDALGGERGERGERVRPALESLQRASETSKPSPSNLRSACNANVSFSALGTYATDSPDPARLMPGEEAEVASRVLYRRVALELAAPERRSADDADRALRDATLAAETGDVSSFGTKQVSNANRTEPPRDAAETRDANARERRRGRQKRGRRRPETRREKMFGKLPFRVAGAALDATRVVGGGALRGVGGLLRGLRGIVRGGDEDDAEEPSPL